VKKSLKILSDFCFYFICSYGLPAWLSGKESACQGRSEGDGRWGSSQSGDQTQVSHIAGGFFTV